jgi:hypothetical protein
MLRRAETEEAMDSPREPVRVLLIGLALVAGAGCARTSINLDRDGTIDEYGMDETQVISPSLFAERFGEPDIWRNEGEKQGGLTMTQIWRCLDGQRREVTWRMVQRSAGMEWTIVNDIQKKGECDQVAPSEGGAGEDASGRDAGDDPSAD